MNIRLLSLIIVAIFGFFGSGCNTLTKGTKDPVSINSHPQGALVKINGTAVGKTPTTYTLSKRTRKVDISLEKPGYEVWSTQLQRKPDDKGWISVGNAGNLAATFISPPVGISGFLIDGFVTKANYDFPDIDAELTPGYNRDMISETPPRIDQHITMQHSHTQSEVVYRAAPPLHTIVELPPPVEPIYVRAPQNPVKIHVVTSRNAPVCIDK